MNKLIYEDMSIVIQVITKIAKNGYIIRNNILIIQAIIQIALYYDTNI